MYTKSKFKSNFKSKGNSFSVKYPDIMVKYDDKVAKDFFTTVIIGDVDKLDKMIIQNSIPISIKRREDGRNALIIANAAYESHKQKRTIEINYE